MTQALDQQISRSANERLTEFSDELREAMVLNADLPLWAAELGYVRPVKPGAVKTKFPISVDAAGYKEFEGDMKYRTLYGRQMQMKLRKWQDGVDESADAIENDDFVGWLQAPANMALAWRQLPNDLVADMLATSTYDGPLLELYRDPDVEGSVSTRRLFAADHPVNVLDPTKGTFQNFGTTTVAAIQDGSFFSAMNTYFSGVKGPNGKPFGLQFDGVLAPGTRAELFRNVLAQDTLIQAVRNVGGTEIVAAGTVKNTHATRKLVVGVELRSEEYVYAFAAAKPGMHTWVVQQEMSPEEIIRDKSSDYYATTTRVSLASIGKANVGAMFPHRIYRVQIV